VIHCNNMANNPKTYTGNSYKNKDVGYLLKYGTNREIWGYSAFGAYLESLSSYWLLPARCPATRPSTTGTAPALFMQVRSQPCTSFLLIWKATELLNSCPGWRSSKIAGGTAGGTAVQKPKYRVEIWRFCAASGGRRTGAAVVRSPPCCRQSMPHVRMHGYLGFYKRFNTKHKICR
jgi:hypothetical protein